MAFENFPYTDFHNLNNDWLLCEMKKLLGDYSGIIDNISEIEKKLTALSEAMDNFYEPDVFFHTIYEVVKEYVDSGIFEEFIRNAVEDYYISGTPTHNLTNAQKQAMYITAMSYYANAWATRNPHITYGNAIGRTDGKGTVLDTHYNNVTDFSLIDCSTFVLLCLMGQRFQGTKYANNANNEPSSKLGYSRDFIITAYPESKGKVRWAYELYLQAMLNRWLYKPKSLSDLQTGDIVFFKWTDAWIADHPDTFGAKAYNNIAHVAMVVDNCDNFTSGIGIVHATSSSAVMAYQDLQDYISKLTTQEYVPYVMRPVLTATDFYVNGVYRYRRGLPVVQSKSSYTYIGGKVPSNMFDIIIDKTTGSMSSSNKRWTSFLIPAEIDFFVKNSVSGVGYNVCFYSGVNGETYIGYSQNSTDIEKLKQSTLMRIEFYKSDGSDMTTTDKANIINGVTLNYHTWSDSVTQNDAKMSAANYTRDSVRYSSELINNSSQVIL